MNVTNVMGLPAALVSAVSIDRHNKPGEISATTLNKGIPEILLTERHFDELTVDAADSIWAVWGTAVHTLFEKQKDNCFHEEAFEVPVLGHTVTGRVDSYDLEHEEIVDWKTASVWKVIMADFDDWHKQGMTYAWLLMKNGLKVKKCRFVAILKDHSKSKAKIDNTYPQSPVFVYEFAVTPEELEDTGKRITEKIAKLELASELPDDKLPVCSPEERWATESKYALMKNGRKTAVKLYGSKSEAEAAKEQSGAGFYVEDRPGEDKKCSDYCLCNSFCSYYKSHHEQE